MFRRFALVLALMTAVAAPAYAEPSDDDLRAILASTPVEVASSWHGQGESTRVKVLAVGAVAGVVALNLYMGGLAYLPFTGAVAATPLATAESIVAISRVYAVTSAAAGALIANYIYDRAQEREDTSFGR